MDIVSGEPCGVNQPGDMLIHTPSIMKGYLDMPDATAAVIDADGFLHTGIIIIICMLYLYTLILHVDGLYSGTCKHIHLTSKLTHPIVALKNEEMKKRIY